MQEIIAFPTIIYQQDLDNLDELNLSLRKDILDKELKSPGLERSIVNGWHSDIDFFTWNTPAVNELSGHIQTCVKHVLSEHFKDEPSEEFNIVVDAWANILRKSGFNRLHVHPNSNWSGVYYVDVGDDMGVNSGRIEFLDPRNRQNMFSTFREDEWMILKPKNGKIVIFPSWLYHSVSPYMGTEERISVAFNVSVHKIKK